MKFFVDVPYDYLVPLFLHCLLCVRSSVPIFKKEDRASS